MQYEDRRSEVTKTTTEPAVPARVQFAQRFSQRPAFLPVIYTSDAERALWTVDKVITAGADGVFLVSHGVGYQRLLRAAQTARSNHPQLFIGVNCVDLRPQDIICRLPNGIDAVWCNETRTSKDCSSALAAIRQARQQTGWTGYFFMDLALNSGREADSASGGPAALLDSVSGLTITANDPADLTPERLAAVRRRFSHQVIALAGINSPATLHKLVGQLDCVMASASRDNGLEQLDLDLANRIAATVHGQ